MKCPLLCIAIPRELPVEGISLADCLKEECAWWDESVDCCSVLALSKVSAALGNTIAKIADRKSIKVQLAK